MLRVSGIQLTMDENEKRIKHKITQKLRIKSNEILSYRINKKSIDARNKDRINFIYTVDVDVKDEAGVLSRIKTGQVVQVKEYEYNFPKPGEELLENRPVIVGNGPCGLFAALIFAQMGYKPLILERGKKVDERAKEVELFWEEGILNPESNVQFGEGGAGTFSDGKLTTQIKNTRCQKVLDEFVAAGATEDILYKQKPHVGTDILRNVVKNMRHSITQLGGEFIFQSKLTDIIVEDGGVCGVEVNSEEIIPAEVVVLAIGHSARDTFEMLHEKEVAIAQKSFSLGVRIEHPQDLINKSQHGRFAGNPKLGAAEYKLSHRARNDRGVYTFCMCPGGMVIGSSSEEGGIVTNGMSEYKRDQENANSAILVNIGPKDYGSSHPLAGMYLQREYEQKAFKLAGEKYHAPAQLVGDFMKGVASVGPGKIKPSFAPGVTWTDLSKCLPDYVTKALKEAIPVFDRRIKGFGRPDAVMTGIETRSSSPIRIPRNDQYETNIRGLYPAGEGGGHAGGITSAAVDGIQVAEAIILRYKQD